MFANSKYFLRNLAKQPIQAMRILFLFETKVAQNRITTNNLDEYNQRIRTVVLLINTKELSTQTILNTKNTSEPKQQQHTKTSHR